MRDSRWKLKPADHATADTGTSILDDRLITSTGNRSIPQHSRFPPLRQHITGRRCGSAVRDTGLVISCSESRSDRSADVDVVPDEVVQFGVVRVNVRDSGGRQLV